MTREEIFDTLSDVVREQLGQTDVVGTALLKEDLGADSLDLVEMIMAIEEKFNIEIADEEVENIKSVDEFVDFIVKKTEVQ